MKVELLPNAENDESVSNRIVQFFVSQTQFLYYHFSCLLE